VNGGGPSGAANRGLVLVVEDEKPIAELVRTYLVRDGFTVITESSGETALAAVRRHRPVALILDIGLPDLDGTEVCRRLRAQQDWTPVLFLTARDDELDRLLGLELGGDDYITKPFSPRELVARVRTVLRRASGSVPEQVRSVGPVTLDVPRRRALVDDSLVELTTTEFDLLAHLMDRPGRVCTRSDLLAAVWGHRSDVGTRTVDVHIAQLRAKLGRAATTIRTVRGVGYSIED
jgi:two-component system, OmpR family, response regulator